MLTLVMMSFTETQPPEYLCKDNQMFARDTSTMAASKEFNHTGFVHLKQVIPQSMLIPLEKQLYCHHSIDTQMQFRQCKRNAINY